LAGEGKVPISVTLNEVKGLHADGASLTSAHPPAECPIRAREQATGERDAATPRRYRDEVGGLGIPSLYAVNSW